MRTTVHIEDIRDYVILAQQALMHEKGSILALAPADVVDSREEYAFTYLRAERFGMQAIEQRLKSLHWLPLQIDPSPEMMGKKRAPMNRWIASYATQEPDTHDFGNELMHVLTRAALHNGWDSLLFLHVASRVARLFHDLCCVLNMSNFLALLAENDIETVSVDLSGDILNTVTELSKVVENPGIYVVSRGTRSRSAPRKTPHKEKNRGHLHLVHSRHEPHHHGPNHSGHRH